MMALEYIKEIEKNIERIKDTQMDSIQAASQLIKEAVKSKKLLHVFGCGHSQMYAEEVFYRAGGLVPVNAILEPALSLRPEAPKSTWFERLSGYAKVILDNEDTKKGDVIVIASTSGRNAVPIEMALEAKKRGIHVIALTSGEFTNDVTSRHESGKKLIDIADVVLDNCGVSGDAVLEIEGFATKFGPTSSVIGFMILQSVIAQAISDLIHNGDDPSIWVSSNLDKGDDINKEHIKQYKEKIKCL
ncbi:SIS domain-containing protein [Paraliobacillus salinarum]|uniref:SIS domain-containing protein n=1 Tax=Paraliobacillus salinarum TaxID=1158996 RepID=UPI0015F49455|nr:SIS domain-containing protein [Paraliobacillus salinarum]